MDKLPEIQVSPLEGNPFLKMSSLVLLVFLVLALLSKGFLSVFFWILTAIIGFFIFGNLYGRLSSKWRRLHYPLMVRYAKSAGFVQGIYEKQGKDFDVDAALHGLLLSVFPQMPDFLLSKYLQRAYDWEHSVANEEMLKEFFKKKKSDISETKLRNIVKAFKKFFADHFASQEEKHVNFIKVRLVIAELIKEKYGEDVWLEYLYAVTTGQAT